MPHERTETIGHRPLPAQNRRLQRGDVPLGGHQRRVDHQPHRHPPAVLLRRRGNRPHAAAGAARQALARSGIDPAGLGCVLCATVSPDYATPSLACLVQAELGLPEDIPVLDVNAACSGFLYALAAARGFLAQSG